MHQDELIAGLGPTVRRLFRAFEERGPMKVRDLRADIVLRDGEIWKGRIDGLTTELGKLQERGLIRQIGTDDSMPGPPARVYDVTPEDEIERAALKFRNQRPQRKRDMSGTAARIADYRCMEKEAGTSSRARWIEARRRVVELSMYARRLEPMAYWSKKSVPDDELELVYDEAVSTLAAFQRLVAAVDTQRGDKQLREKIKALYAKADGTEYPGEAEVFRHKARELEAKLDAA